jgi:hypothetical protein
MTLITRRSPNKQIGPQHIAINEFLGGEEIEVGLGKVKYAIPLDMSGKKLSNVIAVCDSGPLGSDVNGRVLKNGLAVDGSEFTIPTGQQHSSTIVFSNEVDTADLISIEVTQVGASEPGTLLTITIGIDD